MKWNLYISSFNSDFIKTFIFLMGGLLLFLIFNFFYFFYFPANEFEERLYELNFKKNIDTLIMGDSYILCAISKKYLPEHFFMLAHKGEAINETYLKLKYITQKRKFKYLILEIPYHIFSSYRKGNEQIDKFIGLFGDKEIQSVFGITGFRLLFYKLAWQFPFFTWQNRVKFISWLILNFFKNLKFVSYKIPWHTIPEKVRLELALNRIKEQFPDTKNSVSEELIKLFNKIRRICQKKNIKIIGVRLPLSTEYLRKCPDAIKRKVNDIINKSKVLVLDYSEYFIDRPDLFYNADHLNRKGAAVFTSIFTKDLKMYIK